MIWLVARREVDEMKSYEAKMQDNTPVPTRLFYSVFLRMNILFINMYISVVCTRVVMPGMKTTNEQGDMSLR